MTKLLAVTWMFQMIHGRSKRGRILASPQRIQQLPRLDLPIVRIAEIPRRERAQVTRTRRRSRLENIHIRFGIRRLVVVHQLMIYRVDVQDLSASSRIKSSFNTVFLSYLLNYLT